VRSEALLLAVGVVIVLLTAPAIADAALLNKDTFSFNASLTADPSPQRQDLNGSSPDIGINADRNLQFGTLFVGASVTKQLNISTGELARLRLESTGNVSRVLNYENSYVVEPPIATAEIKAEPTEPGYYTGEVRVTALTPGSVLGDRWLELQRSY
jgi:hypothetical protein